MKSAISNENMDKLRRISAQIKDSNIQKEFTNKFMTEIDMLMNHYIFDEALRIVPQIESEFTTNIKACYFSVSIYTIKEDWANLERIRKCSMSSPFCHT
jgi:hypothetical protein